ncbi:MAG: 4-(cytidine 5'-diphospho)-2-C-methyl-D-erythritol kinase [Thiohalomonadaceae bacterium]
MNPVSSHSHAPWPAPAKLNLFLHVTGRRADGFHLLQTVFQFLDYGDVLHFTVRDDGVVRRVSELPGVAAEADLVVRAACLLQAEAGCALGVDIAVEKILPMGGGLGGGSSDAATTLVALNALWRLGLDEDRLAALGLRLGADVPVFVRGRAAWAEGVGERLAPVDLPEPWYLVLVPSVSVSTAEVFGAPELTRDCPPITIRDFLAGRGGNVCEPVVRARFPAVAEALDWLGRFAPARMTGTGCCVFAAFADEEAARAVAARLPAGWRGFVARGRNRSALLERLAQGVC